MTAASHVPERGHGQDELLSLRPSIVEVKQHSNPDEVHEDRWWLTLASVQSGDHELYVTRKHFESVCGGESTIHARRSPLLGLSGGESGGCQ